MSKQKKVDKKRSKARTDAEEEVMDFPENPENDIDLFISSYFGEGKGNEENQGPTKLDSIRASYMDVHKVLETEQSEITIERKS